MASHGVQCLFIMATFFNSITSQYYDHSIGISEELLTTTDDYSSPITTKCNTYTYFRVFFPYPCKDLIINVKPSQGRPEIYVSKANLNNDPYPTKYKQTWAAYESDLYSLIINRYDPESYPGYYYIGVHGDCSQQSLAAVYILKASVSNDPSVSLYNTDILSYPELGLKKIVAANSYTFFRFCVPACANVKITLNNCIDATTCPKTYSYPELLVTREKPYPTLKDFSYKMSSRTKRHIWVNHTDPSSRDKSGFIQGPYYVGVFGYCTPQQYVLNNATDGPCTYAKNTKFNVTVKVYPIAGSSKYGECPEESQALMLPTPPSYPLLQSGVSASGSVACTTNGPQTYTYYTLAVLQTGTGSKFNSAQIVIGKYPNLRPTISKTGWASYGLGLQNLTISAFDPAFNGGYVCGPDGASECLLYIGVTGYCAAPNSTHVDFTLTATLAPLANNILRVPQVNQIVGANSANQYQFCVGSKEDVTAQLKSFTSACDCPKSYANLSVAISRRVAAVGIDSSAQDLGWRIKGGDLAGVAKILTNISGIGTYHLNVLGNCNNAASCKGSECTCGPCSNLPASNYSLYVGTSTDFALGKNASATLGSCAVAGGLGGYCKDTCPLMPLPISSFLPPLLSSSAQAGIAAACLAVTLALLGAVFFYNYRPYLCCWTLQFHLAVVRRDTGAPLFEMSNPGAIDLPPPEQSPLPPNVV